MEEKLDQADVLDRLRLDVLDPADVEEVILVVEDEIAFHLRGVHAAVGLGDVDDGQVEFGKDVDGHSFHGKTRAQGDSQYGDENCEGPPQSEVDEPHAYFSFFGVSETILRKGAASPWTRMARASARQMPSLATASSISAWARRRWASATSVRVPSPES